MVTEALKSTLITNRDATPLVLNSSYLAESNVQQAIAQIACTTAKTTGSTYRMCEVPSNCRLSSVMLACDALGASTTFDVGVYRNTKDGGAAVSQAFFASAVDVSAALAETNITNESGTNTIAKQNKQLWDAVGLTSDPGGTLDIVITTTATINTGGNIQIKVSYVM